jgi:hypothetical protein
MPCFSSGHTCCVTFSLTYYPYFKAYLCFTSTPQAHLPYFTSRSTNFTAVPYPPCFISRPTCRASLLDQPAMFSSRPTCHVSLPDASAVFHIQTRLPCFTSRLPNIFLYISFDTCHTGTLLPDQPEMLHFKAYRHFSYFQAFLPCFSPGPTFCAL